MSLRNQALIYLVLLAICDTLIPIPITAVILLFILFQRPAQFKMWVDDIYRRH